VLGTLPGSGQPLRLIPTGAGEPRDITHDGMDHGDPVWLSDGKRVLFVGIEAGHGPRNYLLDVDTGQARAVTPEGTRGTVISPDGKVAAVLTANGNQALWALDGGEMRPIKGVNSNEWVVAWTSDGKSLYVTPSSGPDALPRKVFILDPVSGQRRLWKALAPSDLTGIKSVYPPVIARDSASYAYTYTKSVGDLYIVEGVK